MPEGQLALVKVFGVEQAGSLRSYYGLDSVDGPIYKTVGKRCGEEKNRACASRSQNLFLEIGSPPQQPSVYSEGNLVAIRTRKRLFETWATASLVTH